ncbi:hypothetical protein [Burkholderia sp. JKS000303]|uniref:hypothetical protein n=1 Tax=Burkholderia sp. JKS000303 TaxID=1938747 RepID=UPI000BF7B8E4|nr:hypothetical protein [Burkholderia sp. JKS000303]PFH12858.1 hypothetical protein BX604_7278 [Burkholderia sp. JKS000303]
MLRILDTESDTDAILLGCLLAKLGVTEVIITAEDELVMRSVLDNGAFRWVVGADHEAGSVTLRLLESSDIPASTDAIQ